MSDVRSEPLVNQHPGLFLNFNGRRANCAQIKVKRKSYCLEGRSEIGFGAHLRARWDEQLILINKFAQEAFMVLLFLMPFLALGLGLSRRIKWLIWVAVCEAALLVISLTTLTYLVDAGSYPASTGMEGIALFVMPALYFASVTISFAVYGIVVWIALRR